MSDLLKVRGLGLHKDGTQLLKNINFSVGPGEIFGISGRSGSGKSTLLRLLCRLEEPNEGEVYYQGESIFSLETRKLRRAITLVFQTPTLLCSTVAEEIRLGFTFQPYDQSTDGQTSDWSEEILRKVHLDPRLLSEHPKKLSVGEAQRVALGRALAIQPKILLLDEPTSALDHASKEAIEETLRECAKRGMSIILVSHDARQLQTLAAKGLELGKGEAMGHW